MDWTVPTKKTKRMRSIHYNGSPSDPPFFFDLLYAFFHTRLGKSFLIKEKDREKMENEYTYQKAIRVNS